MSKKPQSVPISLIHASTGYRSQAILLGAKGILIVFDGHGDSPGAAIDEVVEALINAGHGHHKMWNKGSIVPDPAQIIDGTALKPTNEENE